MAIRFTLLCALGAMLALPAAARAQEPTVSAPDVRPAQGTAPAGPACGMASPRRVDGPITIDVRGDCGVSLDAGGTTIAIDTDSNPATGDAAGADRILSIQDGQATITVVGGTSIGATVTGTTVVTTVEALGLLPGRPARLTSTSGQTVELLVDFGDVAGVSETIEPARIALQGRAKVGRTLSCFAPAGMSKPRYRWLRGGRPIHGATNRTIKLRKADGGRRVSCRVTGMLNGERATVTSAAVSIKR
jgi:hypothetical protein